MSKSRAALAIASMALMALFSASLIEGVLADSATSDISVKLASSASLTIVDNNNVQNLVALDIAPNASGAFATSSTNVIASTNNETGYTLTMSDADDDTALSHADTAVSATLPTLTASSNEESFPVNHYGYSFNGATDYSPIPALSSPVTLATTTAQGTSTYPFTVAAKVDTAMTSGTYQGTITFSLTTNYVPPAPFGGITNMQEMTADICSAATIGDEATLKDTRDNKTYNIRKMEDGKCWMIQNLALGDTTGDITLTPQDSNVSANFTIPTSAVQTSGNTDWRGSNTEADYNTVHVYNNGDAWIQPTSSGSSATVNTTGTPPSQSQYIGSYYNWYTATAGTGTYAMTSGEATSSICPKGWKLPTGGANSDITGLTGALVNITTNTNSVPDASFTLQSAPNYFVLSGFYVIGVFSRSSGSNWWSSTASSSYFAYHLYLIAEGVSPQGGSSKGSGFSVRCVAEPPATIATIDTMQEMATSVCANSSIGDSKALRDTRDNKTYVVKKLADNRCWMVQNLRLGGSSAITLTPADSNVTTNFTLDPSSDSFGTTNDAAGININRMHDNGNTWIDSSNAVQTSGAPPSQTQYIGNYYNWYTATAGTGTYEMSTDGDNATQSICPKGWRLPKGGAIDANTGNGEFQQLYDAYGNYADFISNTSAVLSGVWSVSSAFSQGSYGVWWSSTGGGSTYGDDLSFNSSNVYPQVNIVKRYGCSVRCLAE